LQSTGYRYRHVMKCVSVPVFQIIILICKYIPQVSESNKKGGSLTNLSLLSDSESSSRFGF
jgi:hypothetical protein